MRIRNVFIRSLQKVYPVQRNGETILDQGTPIKTILVANIRAAYYVINTFSFIGPITQAKKYTIKSFMIMQECHYNHI